MDFSRRHYVRRGGDVATSFLKLGGGRRDVILQFWNLGRHDVEKDKKLLRQPFSFQPKALFLKFRSSLASILSVLLNTVCLIAQGVVMQSLERGWIGAADHDSESRVGRFGDSDESRVLSNTEYRHTEYQKNYYKKNKEKLLEK